MITAETLRSHLVRESGRWIFRSGVFGIELTREHWADGEKYRLRGWIDLGEHPTKQSRISFQAFEVSGAEHWVLEAGAKVLNSWDVDGLHGLAAGVEKLGQECREGVSAFERL